MYAVLEEELALSHEAVMQLQEEKKAAEDQATKLAEELKGKSVWSELILGVPELTRPLGLCRLSPTDPGVVLGLRASGGRGEGQGGGGYGWDKTRA